MEALRNQEIIPLICFSRKGKNQVGKQQQKTKKPSDCFDNDLDKVKGKNNEPKYVFISKKRK